MTSNPGASCHYRYMIPQNHPYIGSSVASKHSTTIIIIDSIMNHYFNHNKAERSKYIPFFIRYQKIFISRLIKI